MNPPIIIFCSDPLRPRYPDEMYEAEADAVKALGYTYALIHYEALVDDQQPQKAVRSMPQSSNPGIYRGWMLKPAHYALLYNALLERGITLINPPAAYQHCHYLPESYPVIENLTPRSVWTTGSFSMDTLMELLRPFGSNPLIVKDYVKSQKHYWEEACFIPAASDREAVERVVTRFLELQGDDLNEGLVFREFVELEPLTTHSKSGMPLTQEFRVFVLDGKPVLVAKYWEEGDYTGNPPDLALFQATMQAVQSRFFTMDIARRKNGGWMITELGDAQVAGLPAKVNAADFYRAILTELAAD